MAELMFKRGKQSALNTIITNKTAIDGCFYLTEDTNRLYVGQGDNTAPILLNQTVQIVDNIASLPASPPATKNDFYYCVAENILAVYNGEKWCSVTNIGVRPTVRDGETQSVCETHIIGFEKDIYGEEIKVEFYKLHRHETEFDSLEKLSSVLKNDVSAAAEYFKTEDIK